MAHHCADYAHTERLRAAAGRGLTAIVGRGQDGLSRRWFLLARPGWRCRCTGRPARAAAGRGGRRAVRRRRAGDRAGVLSPQWLRLPSSAHEAEEPLALRLPPKLALPPGAGTEFGEDARLCWHRRRRRSRTCRRQGRGLGDAGGRLRAPGPVAARRATSLGRRARPAARPRAGSAATWTASVRRTTRCSGLALDLSRRRSPPRACRSRRSTRDGLRARRLGDVDALMLDASARIGAVHARRPGAGAGRRRRDARWRAALAARAAARGRGRRAGVRQPVGLPRLGGVRLPGAPRRARADAGDRAAAALRRDHRAGRLRHARQPGRDPRRAVRLTCEALAVQARPRGARARRPRTRVHVWSGASGRRAASAKGADHGAARLRC